ncbi:MAG: hypothetical protein M1827_006196 [Pycnora praestabilis]|nr:MAG: hypothetical protein M1827_006196 [Pycnora praestabilis]
MVEVTLRRACSEIFRPSNCASPLDYDTGGSLHKSSSAPSPSFFIQNRHLPGPVSPYCATNVEMATAEPQIQPMQKLRLDTSTPSFPFSAYDYSPIFENGMSKAVTTPSTTRSYISSAAQSFLGPSAFGRVNTQSSKSTFEEEDNVGTPPLDIPVSVNDGYHSPMGAAEETESSHYIEPSPLEHAFRNRSTSIKFNQQVTLDNGHKRSLDEPLPKSETQRRPRGRSILHELSDSASICSHTRSHSESERSRYDSSTDEIVMRRSRLSKVGKDTEISQQIKPQYLLLQTSMDGMARGPVSADHEPAASLTSDSTISPAVEEIRTPVETPTPYVLSPLGEYSPLPNPHSLEESSAWPMPRRTASSHRSRSYQFDRPSNLRRGRRGTSIRSNSSASMSPASAFLSNWGKVDAAAVVEPDDEGQEVGNYVLGKQIGFGGFSIVKEAYTIEDNNRVARAVKIVRKRLAGKEEHENEQLQAEFEHEVSLWRCLSHRHILPLIAVYDTDYATFCFMQSISGGSLFDLIRANREGLDADLAKRYTYQLASAIRYLHEDVHVIHRDIKLENCLVDKSDPNAAIMGGNILLCDFGMAEFTSGDHSSNDYPDPYERMADRPPAKNIGPSESSTSIVGSLQYASPELILSSSSMYSKAADIWAFGVVLYALLVGDLPFQHTFQPRVQMMILKGEWDEEALRAAKAVEGSTNDVVDLVRGCLAMEVEDRWTIARVLESPWLQGFEDYITDAEGGWRTVNYMN